MRVTVEIVKCPSGFWAVLADGKLFYGAATSEEQARRVAETIKA
jgi:hypothetical protein